MAAVRHLGFLKFNFLAVGEVKRTILHHHTKFRKDWSNHCGDIAIFVIFKMAAVRHLRFVGRLLEPPTMTTWWSIVMPNLVTIDAVVSIT